MLTDDAMRRLLGEVRTLAVVGLSADDRRPSHFASSYLQKAGYRIRPVNPRYAGEILLGERCVERLEDLGGEVDVVNVFRRTEEVLPLAHSAIAIGARCLWQQLGVVNAQAHALAESAGLVAVMDRCIKIEHARLMGGPHRGVGRAD